MASNEGQGIQVALIIFVLLTVVLSITTFLFFRQYDSARQDRDQAVARATQDSNTARETQEENNNLKLWMGFPDDSDQALIKAGFGADMQLYAATYPEVQQSYRQILAYLYDTTLRDLQDRNERLRADNARFEAENIQREKTRQLQIKQHADAAAAAEASQKQQQDASQATFAQLKQTKDELQADLDALRRKLDQFTAEKTKEIADLNNVTQILLNTVDGKNAIIEEIRTESFEVPDGRVLLVNQRTGTVWLDLGRADGLRRSVTFSVHDQDSNTVLGAGLKGRIEVTRIVGEHLAEARILEDVVADPIVRNDKVYSPLWHPGRTVHFAFAGILDMDGDGKSDRQTVRDLVTLAGGVIDAEVTDAGVRTGQLSLETRYLVLGAQPEFGTVQQAGAAFEGYSQIQREAGQLGTKVISFEKFLDSVGWKDSRRVLHFGKVADPADFIPPAPDGGRRAAPGSTSELFRRRDPRELRKPKPTNDAPPRAGNAEPAPM